MAILDGGVKRTELQHTATAPPEGAIELPTAVVELTHKTQPARVATSKATTHRCNEKRHWTPQPCRPAQDRNTTIALDLNTHSTLLYYRGCLYPSSPRPSRAPLLEKTNTHQSRVGHTRQERGARHVHRLPELRRALHREVEAREHPVRGGSAPASGTGVAHRRRRGSGHSAFLERRLHVPLLSLPTPPRSPTNHPPRSINLFSGNALPPHKARLASREMCV